jgi:ADP-ribosylglycohydrolase
MAESKSIVNSALWAAYGDALGFITELVDLKGLKRRIQSSSVDRTVTWKRSVGGKFGALAELPAGTYSDDTQLRLATSRAIRGDGQFDVEAFAKVELTIWPTYSLGGGTSTKAAASALANPNVTWFSNFFDSGRIQYVHAGGNGAAMRIQPLVWSAGRLKNQASILTQVVRNSICSHGHPRAMAGAAFHALCLWFALERKSIPGPQEWKNFAETVSELPGIIRQDADLRSFWIPTWEDQSRTTLEGAFSNLRAELLAELKATEKCLSDASLQAYSELVTTLNGTSHEVRGSGTKTAIIAAGLAWMFRSKPVDQALITAANFLGSDTDTIATMAGAIMGSVASEKPREPIQDRDYIEEEALRLYSISTGKKVASFRYPDLLQWQPPRTQLDGVIHVDGSILLSGIGVGQPIGAKYHGRASGAIWQWLKLDFGQTVLAKQREKMSSGELTTTKMPKNEYPADHRKLEETRQQNQPPLFSTQAVPLNPVKKGVLIDDLTTEAIRSGFNSQVIGDHLLRLAESPEGIELAIAYTAIIAKARRARLEANRRARS